MLKGHKVGSFKKSGPQPGKSANETAIGLFLRKNRPHEGESKGVFHKWVKKNLPSQQEVLIECITGEIYRYLIGDYQPKVRTGGSNVILSEFIPYRSVRDIIDKPKYKDSQSKFKEAFIEYLDGFMLVLFSAIVLEENDLSDMNYGLAIAEGGVDEEGMAIPDESDESKWVIVPGERPSE